MSNPADMTTPEGRAAAARGARAARTARAARAPRAPREVCETLVARIAAETGEDWTFGYIGDVSRFGDDRAWYAFRPHPGRMGTSADRIGGFGSDDLDKLAHVLSGALQMARMMKA